MSNRLYPQLEAKLNSLPVFSVDENRNAILLSLIEIIQGKLDQKEIINLNFICTHNSRRSQISQIWAAAIAYNFGVTNINLFSGGTEQTAFHPNAIKAMEKAGFKIKSDNQIPNPKYSVYYSDFVPPLICFSKVFDDSHNDGKPFIAIMTCSDAETNCPFIPDAEKRIAVRYQDPKHSDNTPEQELTYDLCSDTIAAELYIIFSKLKLKN